MREWTVPRRLAASCQTDERAAWLHRLPEILQTLEERWPLTLGQPFEEVSCGWVAPAKLEDGTLVVLKAGMPHMEGEDELEGLLFWNGVAAVRVLRADRTLNAMLLERCEPGTTLHVLPEPEQDVVIAGLLRRLWRLPPAPHRFRPLSSMLQFWASETLARRERWADGGLVREGLRLFQELPRTAPEETLLTTDLHAGNVLRTTREPWLVIDPKPFIGDPAYDATQHLFNCSGRLLADANGFIRRVADLLEMKHERVGLWMFARAAAEPRRNWGQEDWKTTVARAIAP